MENPGFRECVPIEQAGGQQGRGDTPEVRENVFLAYELAPRYGKLGFIGKIPARVRVCQGLYGEFVAAKHDEDGFGIGVGRIDEVLQIIGVGDFVFFERRISEDAHVACQVLKCGAFSRQTALGNACVAPVIAALFKLLGRAVGRDYAGDQLRVAHQPVFSIGIHVFY